MDKTMQHHDSPDGSLLVFFCTFMLGIALNVLDWLPADMWARVATTLFTGFVSVVGGLLAKRIIPNILKAMEKRRLLPSILKDPEAKDKE